MGKGVLNRVAKNCFRTFFFCVFQDQGSEFDLDSSAITAIAAAAVCRRDGKEPLKTFSVDYYGNEEYFLASEFQPDADTPWIKKVSDSLGTSHRTCFLETQALVDALFPAVLARDLPEMTDIDASLLLFCRRIKTKATVGLSGECADEVFGGYPWFYQEAEPGMDTFSWSRRLAERLRFLSPELLSLIKPREYLFSVVSNR